MAPQHFLVCGQASALHLKGRRSVTRFDMRESRLIPSRSVFLICRCHPVPFRTVLCFLPLFHALAVCAGFLLFECEKERDFIANQTSQHQIG